MRKTLEAKKGAKLMIESIRRTISPLPNVLNTNQPDVCNIILLSLLLLRRLHHPAAPPTHPRRPAGLMFRFSQPLPPAYRNQSCRRTRLFFFFLVSSEPRLLDRPVNHAPHSCLLYPLIFLSLPIFLLS